MLALLVVLSHPLWAATIIVDETTCTLVDAITAANTDSAVGGCAAGSGPDTIELTTDVTLTEVNNSGTYGDNGLPVVASDITVEGGGFTIERDANAPAFRLFAVYYGGTLNLNDVTVRNGQVLTEGGGLLNHKGTLNLTNSTVSGNSAGGSGGGISSYYHSLTVQSDTPPLTLTNSTVSGNSAAHGGGIGIYSFTVQGLPHPVTLMNTTVSGNSASLTAGGIYCFGRLLIDHSTVSGNSAGDRAGGIWHWQVGDYTSILTNSTVSGNSAANGGGGLHLDQNFAIINSTVSGNSAAYGGGIARR